VAAGEGVALGAVAVLEEDSVVSGEEVRGAVAAVVSAEEELLALGRYENYSKRKITH